MGSSELRTETLKRGNRRRFEVEESWPGKLGSIEEFQEVGGCDLSGAALGDFSPTVASGLGVGSRDRGWAGLWQRCGGGGGKTKVRGTKGSHTESRLLRNNRGRGERGQRGSGSQRAEMAPWKWMSGEPEGWCSSVDFWRWRTSG